MLELRVRSISQKDTHTHTIIGDKESGIKLNTSVWNELHENRENSMFGVHGWSPTYIGLPKSNKTWRAVLDPSDMNWESSTDMVTTKPTWYIPWWFRLYFYPSSRWGIILTFRRSSHEEM